MSDFAEYKEKAGECPYCGNSPTNHTVTHLTQTVSTVLGIGMYRVAQERWFKKFSFATEHLLQMFMKAHAFFSVHMGIMKFNTTDPTKARSYRSQVVWEEAKKRGIEVQQIIIFGRYTEAYRAKIHGGWFHFDSLPIPPYLDHTNLLWLDDKFLLKQLFLEHGVPAPKCFSVTNERQAVEAFKKVGNHAIVKPRIGSRGRHTTTDIKTEVDVISAFKSAQVLNHFVVVEEHLVGNVCRATVINGKLAGFFEAQPPYVIGNGTASVVELITQKNSTRHERVAEILLTPENDALMKRQGFARDSVVPPGVRVNLSQRTGRLFGGETRELLSEVHPTLRAYLEKAGSVVGAPVVGFDVIIERPEEDPTGRIWGIIEANSLPFIDLHYLPLHGKPSNPAAAVWDLWLPQDNKKEAEDVLSVEEKKAETVTTYNAHAEAYAKKFDEIIESRKVDIDECFDLVKIDNPFVFEIGCGGGRDAKYILTRTVRYLGIDISEKLVEISQEKNPSGRFLVADIETYQIPEHVAIIFSSASLLHVPKDSFLRILERAFVALIPGGVFRISTKYASHYHEERVVDQFGPRAFYFYNEHDIRDMAAGFDIVKNEQFIMNGAPWLEVTLQKPLSV